MYFKWTWTLFPTELTVKDTAVHNSPAVTQDPVNSDQNSSQEDDPECHPEPTPTSNISAFSNTGVDLKDPNKYCALCVASFNNPQMALQHYNGRKHQKKMARQELLKAHGKDAQQGIARQWIYVTIHKIYPTLNKFILTSSLPWLLKLKTYVCIYRSLFFIYCKVAEKKPILRWKKWDEPQKQDSYLQPLWIRCFLFEVASWSEPSSILS